MKKVLVMSIPHTGTEFVTDYLGFSDIMPLRFAKPIKDQIQSISTLLNSTHAEFMVHPSKHIFCHIHVDHNIELHNLKKYAILEYAKNNCKIIMPLRHPIENAISYIGRYPDIEMSYCKHNWNVLFDDIIPTHDVFWLDINIAKTKRFNMMRALNKFIGRQPTNNEKFYKYVNEWAPVNHHEECDAMKEAYYKQKELPKGYDFECLDFAVEWYNNKHTELEKLYE